MARCGLPPLLITGHRSQSGGYRDNKLVFHAQYELSAAFLRLDSAAWNNINHAQITL